MADSTSSSAPASTTDALTVVVRDFGRLVSSEPDRLRGLLEDVLGAHARAERLHVDAVVAAAEHGVAAAIMSSSSTTTPVVQRELEARLTTAGMAQALASYGVGAWTQVLNAESSVVTVAEPEPTEPGADTTDRTVAPPLPPPGPPNGAASRDAFGSPPPTALPASAPGPPPTILVGDLAAEPGATTPTSAPRTARPGGRRRLLLAAAVAVAVIAVIGVAVAVQHGGGAKAQAVGAESPSATTTAPATTTTTTTTTTTVATTTPTTVPTTAPFPAETTPWGATLARTWTIQDGAVVGSLTFANPGAAPVSGSQVEVIPKSIAANRAALTFSVEPTVVADDPVVQFDVTLAPGETKTITYRAALGTGLTPSPELLAGWMEEWKQAVAAYLASIDTTPPPLVIGAPNDGDAFETTEIIVTGSSEPGATVTVNGLAANVDPAGNWSIVYTLPGDDNPIAVEATDAKGNKATAAITVHYAQVLNPGPTATTKKPSEPPAPGQTTTTPAAPVDGGTTTTTVTDAPPPPAPPVARGDSYSWTADIDANLSIYPRALSVLANDSGSGIHISGAGGASRGSVSVSGGRVIYSPHQNGPFSDSFSYTITDANGQSSSAGVSVSVGCNTSFQCSG